MTMQQCQACGGIYATTLADGSHYFHVCPPLSVAELAAAVAAGTLVLPNGETPDVAITRRVYTRKNARDENVASVDKSGAATMKSAGAGALILAAGAPPAPVVVDVSPQVAPKLQPGTPTS